MSGNFSSAAQVPAEQVAFETEALISSAGMGTLSSEELAASVFLERAGSSVPDSQRGLVLEFVQELSGQIGHRFAEQVTPSRLLDTYIESAKFLLDSGWLKKFITSSESDPIKQSGLLNERRSGIEGLIKSLQSKRDDFEMSGLDSADGPKRFMERIGLDEHNLVKYSKGDLCVGELFVTQPELVLVIA